MYRLSGGENLVKLTLYITKVQTGFVIRSETNMIEFATQTDVATGKASLLAVLDTLITMAFYGF